MTRTIRLTDGPPVRIDDDQWPSVAHATDEVDHTPKANKRSGWVRVRRHADGRHLVYDLRRAHADRRLPPRGSGSLARRGRDALAR